MTIIQSSHRQASSSFIGECMVEKFRFSSSDRSTPKDIIHHMRTNYGVGVSYYKAWRAKTTVNKLLTGDADDSYALIPKFFVKLKEMNPGASIEGWSKYGGTLLTASTCDGNNQIFPLAFGIVDSENDASWRWFFQNLKNSFGDREGLVIISDRHLSIGKSVLKVFPYAQYCVCKRHLLKNLKLSYKDSLIDKLFENCAKSYTTNDFELNMRLMESIYPTIREYLSNVGFEKWARAHTKERRYQMLTTNISESLNATLKESRDLPVASLLDSVRQLLQRWFYDRSKSAASLNNFLSPWAYTEIHKQFNESKSLVVDPINNVEFQVIHKADNFLTDYPSHSKEIRLEEDQTPPAIARKINNSLFNESALSSIQLEKILEIDVLFVMVADASIMEARVAEMERKLAALIKIDEERDYEIASFKNPIES
ncbi:uncharacterized protein LOC111023450 [Momordica charantia]|uniref:Uncharacterized protein LOC111023450 n=1 Tax=Momordica charantia TaxID=3673 RepID=A0A6J1DTW2_MOMCH|nr:uncharacterized protein LOC111023450 [Momordica charantia]